MLRIRSGAAFFIDRSVRSGEWVKPWPILRDKGFVRFWRYWKALFRLKAFGVRVTVYDPFVEKGARCPSTRVISF